MVGLALPGIAGAAMPSGPAPVTVELRDGRVIEGVLRQIETSRYLLQSGPALYEMTGDEIARVDGREGPPPPASDTPPPVRSDTYEVVRPDGDVELWVTLRSVNDTPRVWTFVQWRAKPHELEMMRSMAAYDAYGHHLTHRVEPHPGSDLHHVIVDLEVPIAPGESALLTRRYLRRDSVTEADEGYVFRFAGDYPEDRIVQRKVRLPRGAEVVRVEPPPVQQFEHEGHPIIVWRRYFPRQVTDPQTIVYRLADGPADR